MKSQLSERVEETMDLEFVGSLNKLTAWWSSTKYSLLLPVKSAVSMAWPLGPAVYIGIVSGLYCTP